MPINVISTNQFATVTANTANDIWVLTNNTLIAAGTGPGFDGFGVNGNKSFLVYGNLISEGNGIQLGDEPSESGGNNFVRVYASGTLFSNSGYGVLSYGGSLDLINDGSIDSLYGIASIGGNDTITNNGTISSSTNGVYLQGSNSAIDNHGVISAEIYGIYSFVGNAVRISNTGLIQLSGEAGIAGIRMDGADNSEIVNSGEIIVSSEFTNGARGVWINTVGGTFASFINYGTVTGQYAFDGGDGQDTVTNAATGVLFGFVSLGNGSDRLSNLGAIYGEITAGAGDDILDLRGGIVTGGIHGGAGNDVYYIDRSDISLHEDTGYGHDRIYSSVSYELDVFDGEIEELWLLDGGINASGNALDNEIYGNSANNLLQGNGGNDTISGFDGNDILLGGSGNDDIDGGAGNDTFLGDSGNDIIDGGLDTDTYDAEAGLTGGVFFNYEGTAIGNGIGTDTISSIERFLGSSYGDLIWTSSDTFSYGRGGDDTLNLYGGNAYFDGGDGNDTVSFGNFEFGIAASLANTSAQSVGGGSIIMVNVESLIGSLGNDTLTGNSGDNLLSGGFGDDTLLGGVGNDFLIGNSGNDLIDGGDGIDTVSYEGSSNAVTVRLWSRNSQNFGLAGNDTLLRIENIIGSQFNDTLVGTNGVNEIWGGDGDDVINGYAGADAMHGGAGDDRFIVDNTDDEVYEASSPAGGLDRVYSSVSYELIGGQNIEYLYADAGLTGLTLTGNEFANRIYGSNGGNDVLTGNEGNDFHYGQAGNDYLNGGTGIDNLYGGSGNDVFVLQNTSADFDYVRDFVVADDQIEISAALFGAGLAAGNPLTGLQFIANATGVASNGGDATTRFVYRTTDGALYFDSNGSAAGGSVAIGRVLDAGGLPVALTAGDFNIVA